MTTKSLKFTICLSALILGASLSVKARGRQPDDSGSDNATTGTHSNDTEGTYINSRTGNNLPPDNGSTGASGTYNIPGSNGSMGSGSSNSNAAGSGAGSGSGSSGSMGAGSGPSGSAAGSSR